MVLWQLTLFKYSLFAAHNNPSPMDGERDRERDTHTERETNTTPPYYICSLAPSLSKVSEVSEGILFGLLGRCRVHSHSHSHSTRHPHVHAHPHHALVGGHSHSHPHAHSHASTRVHHGISSRSSCCRSKAHGWKSLGEHVGGYLVAYKGQKKLNEQKAPNFKLHLIGGVLWRRTWLQCHGSCQLHNSSHLVGGCWGWAG